MENSGQIQFPPAVIAGAYQTGVLGVRSLKRRGVNALCFDCNESLQGFRSIYGPARLCPNPDDKPEEWLRFMKDIYLELGERAVLIPSSDKYVSAIAKHHSFLTEFFILSPGVGVQGELAEKQSQYKLAAEHKMPMPKTYRIDQESDLIEASKSISYPCLIKPMHFREWETLPEGHPLAFKKIWIVNSEQDLLGGYNLAAVANPSVMVQEIIEGPDTSKRVYLACYNKNSERIGNAMFRELRCVPMGFGPASVSEPFYDEEADQICDEFLKNVGYSGICEIEVKRDSRDGKVKLIEANPRLSGGGDAAPYAGVDLCWIHYQDLVGVDVKPVSPADKHFRHVVLRAEGTAIPAYLKAGLLTWKELFKSYKPPVVFYDFELRDWKNSLETVLVFWWKILNSFLPQRKA